MSRFDLHVCTCPCHTTQGMKHIAPCCSKCPHCGQRIKTTWMDEHLRECLLRKASREPEKS